MKIAVVVSVFHRPIAQELLSGARRGFEECGVSDFDVFEVPGAFEIPVMCKRLLDTSSYDALVSLGCVIKGQTDHYEHVCRTCADNVAAIARESGTPIIFEVLMCRSLEQALQRSGGSAGNRGYDGARYACEMVNLLKRV